tara:strand:- start:3232 stop:4131 length:900 start_codon:yes stop_codon:yes gene_type:complete
MAPRLGLGNTLAHSPKVGESLLLDEYPATAAFSLRKLRRSYFGFALKVREANSGNSWEADVGFQSDRTVGSNSLIYNATGAPSGATTLGEFADGGDVHVRTWYDQSFSGDNDAQQPTLTHQPRVMLSGSMVTTGSQTAIQWNNLNNMLISGLNDTDYLDAWFLADTSDSTFLYPANGSSGSDFGPVAENGATSKYNATGADYDAGAGTGGCDLYVNGSLVDPDNRDETHGFLNGRKIVNHHNASSEGWNTFQVGRYFNQSNSSMYNYTGKFADMIFYNSDQSANQSAITANLNDYYSVY